MNEDDDTFAESIRKFRRRSTTIYPLDFDGRITATPREFKRISGLSDTTIYKLLNEGPLKSIKIGKRRLIVLDSFLQMIAEQLEAETPPPKSPTPDRRGSRRLIAELLLETPPPPKTATPDPRGGRRIISEQAVPPPPPKARDPDRRGSRRTG